MPRARHSPKPRRSDDAVTKADIDAIVRGAAPRSVRRARTPRGGDGPRDSRVPPERARRGAGRRRRCRTETVQADSRRLACSRSSCRRPRARRSTIACACRGTTGHRAISTTRIATARSSPVSICTCSAKARTSRRSTSWAPAASRTASATASTSRCGRRMRDASAWSATSTPGTAACTRCARCGPGGYWEIFMPDLGIGDPYKFEIIGADGLPVLKADPCGRYFERPPDTASIVWDSVGYQWQDDDWMASAPRPRAVAAPADVGLRSASRQLAALARRTRCTPIARWPSGWCRT